MSARISTKMFPLGQTSTQRYSVHDFDSDTNSVERNKKSLYTQIGFSLSMVRDLNNELYNLCP